MDIQRRVRYERRIVSVECGEADEPKQVGLGGWTEGDGGGPIGKEIGQASGAFEGGMGHPEWGITFENAISLQQ